jgi:hypothetical protein
MGEFGEMCKLFITTLAVISASPLMISHSTADGFLKSTYKRNHSLRTFGSPSPYGGTEVKALFDSCWRYHFARAAGGRELERIWTCGNYIKPNADFDWTYGSSIADRAWRYGYRW